MLWLIFGIVFLIVGIVLFLIGKSNANKYDEKYLRCKERLETMTDSYGRSHIEEDMESNKYNRNKCNQISRMILIGTSVLTVLFIIFSTLAIVPTGYTGVKTTFGKVDPNVLNSGINFKLPWQNVVNMDNREQRSEFTLEAFSKDIQQVDIRGSINFNIDKPTAMNLYKDVGTGYVDILVKPRIQEDVKIIIAGYTAENLVENRQKASDAIYELLKEELSIKGINVISFAIENIDFTDAFESAVEAKQVATQEKQKAQTEQERQTMEQQQQAERDRIKAQAAADVQKIEADAQAYAVKVQADAQAEANKEIAATLSSELIQYNMILRWNGKLPVVQSSGNESNIIDLRTLMTEGEE